MSKERKHEVEAADEDARVDENNNEDDFDFRMKQCDVINVHDISPKCFMYTFLKKKIIIIILPIVFDTSWSKDIQMIQVQFL